MRMSRSIAGAGHPPADGLFPLAPLHRFGGIARWFRTRVRRGAGEGTMTTEAWLAAGFGGAFAVLLFATAIWLIASGRQVPDRAVDPAGPDGPCGCGLRSRAQRYADRGPQR